MSCVFYQGDCQQLTQRLAEKSVDMVYFNPPFGTTQNFWDSKLNWKQLFAEFFRILKPDGVIVIHCSVPFNYTLIREAPKPPNYSWYWKKENTTNAFLAKVQPLRNTEEILVWTNKKTRYYPQRFGTERITTAAKKEKYTNSYYGKVYDRPAHTETGRLRTHHLDFARDIDKFSTRPRELVELFIKSYTKEGDTVLDPTCFEGMSGVIAKSLNRKWIGFDLYHLPSKLIQTVPQTQ